MAKLTVLMPVHLVMTTSTRSPPVILCGETDFGNTTQSCLTNSLKYI